MNLKLFLATILLISLGHACISLPTVYVDDSEFFYFGDRNITQADFDEYATERVPSYALLTREEKEAIRDFVVHGYSTKKMSEEEYAAFLENAIKINMDNSTCEIYNAVAYSNGWAGWSKDGYSTKTAECAQQPRPTCGGGFFSLFLNDLVIEQDNGAASQLPALNNNLIDNNLPITLVILVIAVVSVAIIIKKRV